MSDEVVCEPSQAPVVPAWAEDETLYSWCCRWHRLTMNRTRTSGSALFGVPSAAKVWIAPNPFGQFCAVTRGALGHPLAILRGRTIVSSYLPLARPEDRRRVESGEVPPSFLVSAKSGIALSLRYCPKCARRHESALGIALWRVGHQLPGTALCVEHGQPLIEHVGKRQLWSVPGTEDHREIDIRTKAEFEAMRTVAVAAKYIADSGALDVDILRRQAQLVVCEGYGVVDVKRLDPRVVDADWQQSTLASWCRRFQPQQVAFPEFWLTDILRFRRSERNPMKWAYLLAYFQERSWSSIDGFLAHARNAADRQLCLWSQMESIPLVVLDAFAKAKNSRQAGKIIGVNGSTIRDWVRTHPELVAVSRHWDWSR